MSSKAPAAAAVVPSPRVLPMTPPHSSSVDDNHPGVAVATVRDEAQLEKDSLDYDTEEAEQDSDEEMAFSVGLDAVIDGDAYGDGQASNEDSDSDMDMYDGEAETEFGSEYDEEDSFALELAVTGSTTAPDQVQHVWYPTEVTKHMYGDANKDGPFNDEHCFTFVTNELPLRRSRAWPKRSSSLNWKATFPFRNANTNTTSNGAPATRFTSDHPPLPGFNC